MRTRRVIVCIITLCAYAMTLCIITLYAHADWRCVSCYVHTQSDSAYHYIMCTWRV